MEKKIKNKQKFIIGVLGLIGIFFIWAGIGGDDSAIIILLGILFCFASVYNIIFYKKIIESNVQSYQKDPKSYKKYEASLKPAERFANMQLLGAVVAVVIVFILIFLSDLGLINLS